MLVDFLFILTLLLTGECQHEEGIQKVAVSLANNNFSCSLTLNLGDNCLERDEAKVEMKAVVEELLQKERETLANRLEDIVSNKTQSVIRKICAEELKVQINNSINQMRRELRAQMQRIGTHQTERLIDLIISLHPVGTFKNPALSCQHLPENSPSRHYWIQGSEMGHVQRRVACIL